VQMHQDRQAEGIILTHTSNPPAIDSGAWDPNTRFSLIRTLATRLAVDAFPRSTAALQPGFHLRI
jgi:hypothetical protein